MYFNAVVNFQSMQLMKMCDFKKEEKRSDIQQARIVFELEKLIGNFSPKIQERRKIVSGIEKLNNDCLWDIFQYLPIVDRIRIERVCKRWQYVSQKSWSGFKKLNFATETWGITMHPGLMIEKKLFYKLIRLCGRFVTDIDFSTAHECNRNNYKVEHCLDLESVLALLKCNPENIRKLNLCDIKTCSDQKCASCEKQWRQIFQLLLHRGKNIVNFDISMNTKLCPRIKKDFAAMLASFKELKFLRIGNFPSFTGAALLKLRFEALEEISVTVDETNFRKLLSIIPRLTNLKVFECLGSDFPSTLTEPEILLEAVLVHAKNLRYLSLRKFGLVYDRDLLLSSISKLIYVEKLNFDCSNFVDDVFLEAIAENCKQVTCLHINGCVNVSDRGILSITKLPKLRLLNMNYLSLVVCPSLWKIRTLEELYCRGCAQLNDEAIYSLLHRVCNLRFLDVRLSCMGDSLNKILATSIDIIEHGNSKAPLNLYIIKDTQKKQSDITQNVHQMDWFQSYSVKGKNLRVHITENVYRVTTGRNFLQIKCWLAFLSGFCFWRYINLNFIRLG